MRSALVVTLGILLIPGLLLAQAQPSGTVLPGGQQSNVQQPIPADTPAAASGQVMILKGRIDTKLVGKPTLTSEDNKEYLLVGMLSDTLEQVPDIDDKSLTIHGNLAPQQPDKDRQALNILAFQLPDSQAAIGMPVPGNESVKLLKMQQMQGKLNTKLVGKPELITNDNVKLRLIGPQVKTLNALDDVDDHRIEVAGQVIGQGENQLMILHAFRVLDENRPLGKIGMIGLITPEVVAPVAPQIRLSGTIDTKLLGKPELQLADGKEYKLIGPQVDVIENTRNIDGQKLEVTGQLVDDGDNQQLVLHEWRLLGPGNDQVGKAAETVDTSGAPAPYGKTSIKAEVGAPPLPNQNATPGLITDPKVTGGSPASSDPKINNGPMVGGEQR